LLSIKLALRRCALAVASLGRAKDGACVWIPLREICPGTDAIIPIPVNAGA
jgi:hypothetical protein